MVQFEWHEVKAWRSEPPEANANADARAASGALAFEVLKAGKTKTRTIRLFTCYVRQLLGFHYTQFHISLQCRKS